MLSLPAYALPRGRPAHSHGATRAFTLIELLTVIALIGILAAITLSVMRGVKERAAVNQAKTELAVLATALESYKRQYGDYPQFTEKDGDPARLYQSLLGNRGPGGDALTQWKKVFIEAGKLTRAKVDPSEATDKEDPEATDKYYLVDPWASGYRYYYYARGASPNLQRGYVLYSSGPDGKDTAPVNGAIDDNADGNADNIYANR